jgi:hypothetical protein
MNLPELTGLTGGLTGVRIDVAERLRGRSGAKFALVQMMRLLLGYNGTYERNNQSLRLL